MKKKKRGGLGTLGKKISRTMKAFNFQQYENQFDSVMKFNMSCHFFPWYLLSSQTNHKQEIICTHESNKVMHQCSNNGEISPLFSSLKIMVTELLS